jgi:tetratricopeptide (TPR) repeat protein
MKIIIIILGGGLSAGVIILAWSVILGGGLVLSVKDYQKWNSLESEVEKALLPPPSYYDSIWYNSRAITHFQKGNYHKAVKEFRKSFELYPNAGTLNLIAATYYYLGDLDSAIDYWDVAVEAYPDIALLRQNLENAQKAREINPFLKPTLSIIEEKQ